MAEKTQGGAIVIEMVERTNVQEGIGPDKRGRGQSHALIGLPFQSVLSYSVPNPHFRKMHRLIHSHAV